MDVRAGHRACWEVKGASSGVAALEVVIHGAVVETWGPEFLGRGAAELLLGAQDSGRAKVDPQRVPLAAHDDAGIAPNANVLASREPPQETESPTP